MVSKKFQLIFVSMIVCLTISITACSTESSPKITGFDWISYEYEEIWRRSDNQFVIKNNGKYSIVDDNLETVKPIDINKEYRYIGRFINGLAAAQESLDGSVGKQGYINEDMEIVIPFIYSVCIDFNEGKAVCERNNQLIIINEKGEEIGHNNDNIRAYSSFHEGLALVNMGQGSNIKHGAINESGEIAIPLKYTYMYDYSEGLACVALDGLDGKDKWGCIDKENNIIIPIEYDYIFPFTDGIAIAQKDDKYGCIDTDGNIVIPFDYEDIKKGKDIFFIAKKNGKYGIINTLGYTALTFEYDSISISDNIALVGQNGAWGCNNYISNEILIRTMWPEHAYGSYAHFIGNFVNGFAVIYIDGKYGLIDENGNIIIEPTYDYTFDSFINGMANATKRITNDKGDIVSSETGFLKLKYDK